MLGWEPIAAVALIEDIAAGSLRIEPFADVPLGRAAAGRELRSRDGSSTGHRAIQAKAISDHHECAVHQRSEVADRFADEGHQPVGINQC